MKTQLKNCKALVLVVALAAVAQIVMARWQPAQAQRAGAGADSAGSPHYTVVETEGHNLIVTDNKSNTL